MPSDLDAALLRRLLLTFKGEAEERIAALSSGLADLVAAEDETRSGLVESMFRDAHSLKAAARSVNQKEIEILCQSIESVFAGLKRGDKPFTDALRTAMAAAVECMEDSLASLDAAPAPERQRRASAVARALDLALGASPPPAVASPPPASSLPAPAAAAPPDPSPAPDTRRGEAQSVAASETVRLSVQRLEVLLRDSEEMLPEKLAARQIAAQLAEAAGSLAGLRRHCENAEAGSTRAQTKMTPSRQLLEPLARDLAALEAHLVSLAKAADAAAYRMGLKSDRLLRQVRDILTLPCATLFQPVPRVIREIARDQAKEVLLTVEGGDLEVDRRILQELRDPLLHLVRNSVDHGIEQPTVRSSLGKPPAGTLIIHAASKDGDKVEFLIADDGAGIASAKVAAKAVAAGLLSPEQAAKMREDELLQLVFESGISTSPMITDISGRGLGLAIVRERVERLGGRISVETEPGRGTRFRLLVPLSLATYHGISVMVGDRTLVFPTMSVAEVVGARRSALSTVEGRPMIEAASGPVPLVSLREILELPPRPRDGQRIEAVVVGAGGRKVAFEVDTVLGDQEILLKPLGKCLVRVRNVQGATILGTGELAPVLNVPDLLKSALKIAARQEPGAGAETGTGAARILLVEDSITARGLLRSILESAGYQVKTAVDGMEAWATLNLESFDCVVSDIEMPRMNGFDLTARIRAHRKLAELPVILVTALVSREDREHGADVGANAYITKSGFEQGTLLEAVRRLI